MIIMIIIMEICAQETKQNKTKTTKMFSSNFLVIPEEISLR